MSKRVAIYARVSSERQAEEDRVSIEAQLADCEALCKQKGHIVVGQFVDKEKYRVRGRLVQPSGQRKDRPKYQAMLKAVRAGEVDLIVAWKEDRLYRGMYAAIPFAEVLDECKGLDVELVRENFDRKMLFIKAALGKIESDNIRERMMMGRRVRLERGEMPGSITPYGYVKVDKHLEIAESEAVVVRKVFDWYIGGDKIMQIRRRLNMAGIKARRGDVWSKSSLANMVLYEPYSTGRLVSTLDGAPYVTEVQPIISLDKWRLAQEIRQKNKWVARNVKQDYLCVGLVYCVCGWKCHTVTNRGNRAKGYTEPKSGSYGCQRYSVNPESRPPDCAISTGSKKVDTYVWDFVKRICARPEILQAAIARKIDALRAEQGDLESEINSLQGKVDEVTNERQWVITQARKGSITEDDMRMQLAALQFQELAYRKELDEKQAIEVAQQQAEALSAWAREYLTNVGAGIAALEVDPAKLSDAERQALAVNLDAERFLERFSGDEMAALLWAMLEERRRVVRTLISKVIVGKGEGGKGRKISPVLALDLPAESSIPNDQSLEYMERVEQLEEV